MTSNRPAWTEAPEAGLRVDQPVPTPALGEARYRSFVKAMSWRLTGTVDTIVVSFLVTGRFRLALSIGFIELFTKICLYYVHERAWNKISFGRVQVKPDYEI